MIRIIYITLALLLATNLSSCKKDDVEIVNQDLSYQLDPDYIFVDIPKEFKFDPSNILYLSGQTNLTLNGQNDTEHTTIVEGNTVTFKIKVKKALDKDVNIRLVKDESLLSSYDGDKNNYIDFPEASYTIPEVRLSAGQTEVEVKMNITDAENLDETPGYLLPLRLEIINSVDGLSLSTMKYSVFVKLNITVMRDNIDSSNALIEGTLFNSNVTFESNKSSGLNQLNDGNVNGGSWYPSNLTTYLTMKMEDKEMIKGIKIITKIGSYQLASLLVKVEETSGYIQHGTYTTTLKTNELFIKFKKPIMTKNIRLENFLTLSGGSQPDLFEVYLIK